MEKEKLIELIQRTTEAMKLTKFKSRTIEDATCYFSELQVFADEKGIDCFSESLVNDFLETKYQYDSSIPRKEWRYPLGDAVLAMRRLSEFYFYSGIFRKKVSLKTLDWVGDDIEIINQFIERRKNEDTAERTKRTDLIRIQKFYDFMHSQGIGSIRDITPQTLSDYVLTMLGDSSRYAQEKISTLRFYLRHLYNHKVLDADLSVCIPRVYAVRNKKVPAIWTEEEIKTLLENIDRVSPVGKRDYAVFVLTIELGLRASDIQNLKLVDFDWKKKEINVVQRKTSKLNVCPLTSRAGWAVIDYLQHGRPKTESPFLFLTATPPYSEFGNVTAVNILYRHMQKCGIHPSRENVSNGMHALRHALARRMLDENVSLETIADVMGHSQSVSTSPYLRVDIEGMRRCLLSVEEVLQDEK